MKMGYYNKQKEHYVWLVRCLGFAIGLAIVTNIAQLINEYILLISLIIMMIGFLYCFKNEQDTRPWE